MLSITLNLKIEIYSFQYLICLKSRNTREDIYRIVKISINLCCLASFIQLSEINLNDFRSNPYMFSLANRSSCEIQPNALYKSL